MHLIWLKIYGVISARTEQSKHGLHVHGDNENVLFQEKTSEYLENYVCRLGGGKNNNKKCYWREKKAKILKK